MEKKISIISWGTCNKKNWVYQIPFVSPAFCLIHKISCFPTVQIYQNYGHVRCITDEASEELWQYFWRYGSGEVETREEMNLMNDQWKDWNILVDVKEMMATQVQFKVNN